LHLPSDLEVLRTDRGAPILVHDRHRQTAQVSQLVA
jgi:hypothetical protein